jgi:hypothetical protein
MVNIDRNNDIQYFMRVPLKMKVDVAIDIQLVICANF